MLFKLIPAGLLAIAAWANVINDVREAIEQKQWRQADEAIVVVAGVLRDEAALISSAAAKLSATK